MGCFPRDTQGIVAEYSSTLLRRDRSGFFWNSSCRDENATWPGVHAATTVICPIHRFFRGIPLLLVLYLVGFGIPGLDIFPRLPAPFWGTIALILTYSSYIAEVLRAGIEAVHPSQRMAARSLGLSYNQTSRVVVMPQAVRKVTPALMNDFVSMQKDVGLISVLGAVDAIRSAQIVVASTYNFTPYVVAGVLFVLMSWPMIRLTDWYTAQAQSREQMGGQV
ncbi:amino acid ABC transporter permease [Scrofimicrobium canadense]|uniref:amino acid ABC transporter permease n=1 Tax=Scrofimicrobium canadense TaxID=2652290 RepID=UPI001CED71C4|nr:amino acid ABC transporter permease [Scrofimicrobium canadense]